MGSKTTVQGGGAAKGVSKDFLNTLDQLLKGGTGSWDPNSVQGAFARLLGGDNSDSINAVRTTQEQQKTEDLQRLAAQFGTSISSRSGVNAMASSRYLSDRAPSDTLALQDILDRRQLAALGLLMPQFGQAVGIGTPQAQVVQKPSFGANLLGGITGIAKAAVPFAGGGLFNSSGPGYNMAPTGPNGWGGNASPVNTNYGWG
jgi:hypothetical protein